MMPSAKSQLSSWNGAAIEEDGVRRDLAAEMLPRVLDSVRDDVRVPEAAHKMVAVTI